MSTSANGWEVLSGYGDSKLVTLSAIGGSSNVLGGDVYKVFKAFCADFATEVEEIVKDDSWGFSPRKVTNGESWSNHASGTAIDLNASKYPMYRNYMTGDRQARVRALLKRYPVLRWGGDYPSSKIDQMHFEVNVTPKELAEFVKTMGGAPVSTKMVSPHAGRVSSEYGWRVLGGVRNFHGGIDLAGSGPVYAAFDGRLSNIVRGRKRGQPATSGVVVAPLRSGNGGRVNNPDGETQVYIHTLFLPKWKNGDIVKAGDLLGYTDMSGNTTGEHLHFETWNSSKLTANPRSYFSYHRISPGSTPIVPSQPAPKPPAEPAPSGVQETAWDRTIQTRLKALGYYTGIIDGKNESMQKAAVKAYQQNQNTWGAAGLAVDGIWGQSGETERWYQWVLTQAQPGLKNYKGMGNVVVDGDYGKGFNGQVRTTQKNNRLYVDGILGNVMAGWMRGKGTKISNRP